VKKEGARKEILQKEAQKLLDDCGKKMFSCGLGCSWAGKRDSISVARCRNSKSSFSFVGDRTLIDKDDVEETVGRNKGRRHLRLTNSLSEKNQLAALEALKNLLDQGDHYLAILTMISREIRLLLQARVLVDSGKNCQNSVTAWNTAGSRMFFIRHFMN